LQGNVIDFSVEAPAAMIVDLIAADLNGNVTDSWSTIVANLAGEAAFDNLDDNVADLGNLAFSNLVVGSIVVNFEGNDTGFSITLSVSLCADFVDIDTSFGDTVFVLLGNVLEGNDSDCVDDFVSIVSVVADLERYDIKCADALFVPVIFESLVSDLEPGNINCAEALFAFIVADVEGDGATTAGAVSVPILTILEDTESRGTEVDLASIFLGLDAGDISGADAIFVCITTDFNGAGTA